MMKSLIFAILATCAAPTVVAVEPNELAGEIAEKIDDLSVQLFLRDADTAYADGKFIEARNKFDWLAKRGSPEARLALGVIYEEGQGVEQDYERAFDWYQKAARQGFAPAQLRLARMYYFGRHVRQDNFLAYVWASLAASQGDEIARRNRDKIGKLMSGPQVSSAQTLADEWSDEYNQH